jgi:hypothetical protein
MVFSQLVRTQKWKEQDFNSWVMFVDLVKAVDIAHRGVLWLNKQFRKYHHLASQERKDTRNENDEQPSSNIVF